MRAALIFLGLVAVFMTAVAWFESAEITSLHQQRDRALQACEAGE